MLRCAGGYRSGEPSQPVCVSQVVVVGVEAPLRVDVLDHQLLLANTLAGDELLQRVARHQHRRDPWVIVPEDGEKRQRRGRMDQPACERTGRVIGGPLHADESNVLTLRPEYADQRVHDLLQPSCVGVSLSRCRDKHLSVRASPWPPQHDAVASQRRVEPDVEVKTVVDG